MKVARKGERRVFFVFSLLLLVSGLFPTEMSGRKVKNTFKVEKTPKDSKVPGTHIPGRRLEISSEPLEDGNGGKLEEDSPMAISFSGYEKETNSDNESFIIVNGSDQVLTGFEARIEYLDITDRMLHSREVKERCHVPPGEARKMDIRSWDRQRSYYYYLGNEPRKVATPYKVVIVPIAYWIEE